MKFRLLAACAALSAALAQTPAAAQQQAPKVVSLDGAPPKRVLFLGNSLVYYSGGLQTHVHRMDAADPRPIDLKDTFKSMHITGAGLHQYPIDFVLNPANLGMKEPFELVVLAGNSLDAAQPATLERYRRTAVDFNAAIRKTGARVALVWLPPLVEPHALAKTDLAPKTEAMMRSVGNEIGALVIPVGAAYREAYRRRPDIKLQVSYDGNHPTLAGQYLAAAVVYASVYNRSPVGNAYNYFGALDDATRTFLQDVAASTVKEFYRR